MKTNYLLINYNEAIETNELFYNRKKNFWKTAKNVKELHPIEEYLIPAEQACEPILSLDEFGKPIVLKNPCLIPVPF